MYDVRALELLDIWRPFEARSDNEVINNYFVEQMVWMVMMSRLKWDGDYDLRVPYFCGNSVKLVNNKRIDVLQLLNINTPLSIDKPVLKE